MPGRWFHVSNRGIGKRTIFESRLDKRVFLADIARTVRLGWLQVHAYAVLTTHYHLMVVDLSGRLSEAIQRAQSRFARWFNRTRERDGAVFRGRFFSRALDGERDRQNVLSYIEHNPVSAGLAEKPGDFEFCSAAARGGQRRCRWLESSLWAGLSAPLAEDVRWKVERSLTRRLRVLDAVEEVGELHANGLEDWMLDRARNADGHRPGRAILGREALSSVIATTSLDPTLVVGLWRVACGMTIAEIAHQVGSSWSATQRRWVAFRELATTSPSRLTPALAVLRQAWVLGV